MKNIIVRTALLGCAVMFATSSCEDFLEQEVPGQFAEQDFYQSDADALQAVSAIYDMLQRHLPNGGWVSPLMVKTLPSDESNAGGGSSTDQPQYQELDDFQYDALNSGITGLWQNLYSTIYRANKVINNVQVDESSSELRKQLVAEAKALRAYAFMELVSLWGPVPIVLTDIAPSEFRSYQRNSIEEVYVQIEQDLSEAIPVLPTKSQYDEANEWRVSKQTAQALLGKAHLYQEEYAEAAAQFEIVIGSGQVTLEPNFRDIFTQEGEFGAESLFEINFTSREDFGWGNFPWNDAVESNIHVQLSGPREDYYAAAPGDSLIGGWGFNTPTEKMYNAVLEAGVEPTGERYWQTIMSEAELEAMGGVWNKDNVNVWDFEGYFRRKYAPYVTAAPGAEVAALNYSTNVILLRYADVLLMAAEANLLKSNPEPAKAMMYLNMVRERSSLLPIVGAVTMDDIILERFVELAFEGHRFQDLLRWDRATAFTFDVENELGDLGFRPRHRYFPIPNDDVLIGGLEQNTGYGQ